MEETAPENLQLEVRLERLQQLEDGQQEVRMEILLMVDLGVPENLQWEQQSKHRHARTRKESGPPFRGGRPH